MASSWPRTPISICLSVFRNSIHPQKTKIMVKKLFSKNYNEIEERERLAIIERSSKQVSRGVFFSTVIIITSFLPVFMLTGQEGKLFHPLAYTKTFIMIVDA